MTSEMALDPLAMLLDAARYIEDSKPAWAAAARKAVAEARTAARPDAGCAVKALEWVRRGDTLSRAECVLGYYRVWTHHEADNKWFWNLDSITNHQNTVDSEAAAKAAAQADYEARIRSALLEQPATPGYAAGVEACRLELSELIKSRILGVRPEDQDLVLEDKDWREIVAALEGRSP
jgi:hypothetical protein